MACVGFGAGDDLAYRRWRNGLGRELSKCPLAQDCDRLSRVLDGDEVLVPTLTFVATAAADIGNLRFYQRLGFRLRSVERDAFTPAAGYEPGLLIDGIELRDRVWLDRRLDYA